MVACTFSEKISSFGGAIYDRSHVMNITGSFLVDKASSASTRQG